MRRLALLSAFAVLELIACKHKASTSRVKARDAVLVTPSRSALKMNDPDAANHFVKGFYGLESDSWRWTASKFAVVLRQPQGAAQNGTALEFKFSLPEVVFSKVGPVTLSAKINGMALPSQTYSKAGDWVYSAAVPPDRLKAETSYVEFSTDKAMPPTSDDRRELALIAVSVALLPK